MKDKIKKMDIKEFREKGLLQEVNRQFFHSIRKERFGWVIQPLLEEDDE